MESLAQLHKQLESLGDLRTIVKTMKALSAASIRQYERAVGALGEYHRTIERGLRVVLRDMDSIPTGAPTHPRQQAAVVFGSDHGLCGRFNEELVEHALDRIDLPQSDGKGWLLLTVGARAAAGLEREGHSIEADFLVPSAAAQITATVQQILLKIDEWRQERGVDEVHLFYNRHSERRGYEPTSMQLFPIDVHHLRQLQEEPWPSRNLPTFTMDQDALFRRILNQYLFVSIFRACAESLASEHASRLAAMQSAERNLDERMDEVTTVYRRARQDQITSELLDVVSGFEVSTRTQT
ncbi:MAG TPA: F0F1 ATP synthase subunit gamma [Polyangiales bacterium]|nr:F0F1 ATP synthase subunit gamma [Polyangiales bacterium]